MNYPLLRAGPICLRAGLALIGAVLVHCDNSSTSTQGAGVDLSGTAAVTNNSTAVTFASPQTLTLGTVLAFSTQPGVPYTLAASITSSTAGVLTAPYTGTTSTTATVLNANACYPDNDGINGGSYTIDLVVNDTGFFASGGDDAGASAKNIIATQNDALVTLTLTNNGSKPHGFTVGCTSIALAYPTLPAGCPTSACFPANATIAPIDAGASVTVTFDTPTPDGLIYPFTSNDPDDTSVSGLNGGQWSLM
jgi:hypothetical protein